MSLSPKGCVEAKEEGKYLVHDCDLPWLGERASAGGNNASMPWPVW